jgi:hypothetical protein
LNTMLRRLVDGLDDVICMEWNNGKQLVHM